MKKQLVVFSLFALAYLAYAPGVSAQTCSGTPTTSPANVAFTVSPDHSATVPVTGVALLSSYALQIFKCSDSTQVGSNVDLGKPTPVGSTATVNNVVPQTLTKDVQYFAKVLAVGPGGSTASAASAPFYFPGPVAAPRAAGAPTFP